MKKHKVTVFEYLILVSIPKHKTFIFLKFHFLMHFYVMLEYVKSVIIFSYLTWFFL